MRLIPRECDNWHILGNQVENWDHDSQKIQGFVKYNVGTLIWASDPRQQIWQGGVTCLNKRGLEDCLSIAKDDARKCYIWCSQFWNWMLHLSSYFVFYACLNREQHFVNLDKAKMIALVPWNASTWNSRSILLGCKGVQYVLLLFYGWKRFWSIWKVTSM